MNTWAPPQITDSLRVLRGQFKAKLVKASDGETYVCKQARSEEDVRRLFNEAFATTLGAYLGLPFPAWKTLNCVSLDKSRLGGSPKLDSGDLAFGSQVVSGDIYDYLPGNWYANIHNISDVYKCLLFDLWCNHGDSRQFVFQKTGQLELRACPIDNDRMFSTSVNATHQHLVARSRFLDTRIYNVRYSQIADSLRDMSARIRSIVKIGFDDILSDVPGCWLDRDHVARVISLLIGRAGHLDSYVNSIERFSKDLTDRRGSQPVRYPRTSISTYMLVSSYALKTCAF